MEDNLMTREYDELEISYRTLTRKEGRSATEAIVERAFLKVPMLPAIKASFNPQASQSPEAVAGQVEAFLVGLGIPLPSRVHAQKLNDENKKLREEARTNAACADLSRSMTEKWREYALALEGHLEERGLAIGRNVRKMRPVQS